MDKYGPFANLVATAGALVAVFSAILLKMMGRMKKWTWIAAESAPFIVTAGARFVAVALMAVIYVTADKSNYRWFGAVAIVTGTLALLSLIRFDHLRKVHVAAIPLVAADGSQLRDENGAAMSKYVVIGTEGELLPEAAAALEEARCDQGISLLKFMSGYGEPVNDPEALWNRDYLAGISNSLTVYLMSVVLLAVITLFVAALVVDISTSNQVVRSEAALVTISSATISAFLCRLTRRRS